MMIVGEVTGTWTGPLTKTRYINILSEDGLAFEIPTREFDKGQKVVIEVKEVE